MTQAGIVWVEGGIIEWARCGITAGGGYGPEFWGGLISTEGNAEFRFNRKDVEFMSYKFAKKNKSKFKNTAFLFGMPTSSNTEGVTIWETDGIEFDHCNIYSKRLEGIRAYDASIKVFNGCNIESNQTGISAYATYPTANKTEIGTKDVENNFYRNEYDINASLASGWFGLYSNGKFSLEVINNNFEGSQYGVIVDGPSNFRIGGNRFRDVRFGTWVRNTGFNAVLNQNFIGCNLFDSQMDIGILAVGDNKQMQFLGNDFNSANNTTQDFVLTNSFFPFANGAIREWQGNPDAPASNCFTDPDEQIDIQAAGQWGGTTDFFTYYHQSSEPPIGCDPEPLTPGNYEKKFVINEIFIVDCDQFGGLPTGIETPTPGDLEVKRSLLQQLATSIATDQNAKMQYYQTLQDKEAILKYLLGQALESEDYITAENLLTGEQSKAANWAIFGLRLGRKDYSAATQLLNQLPLQNDADVQFRDVQYINIQRLQSPGTFQLSTIQEAYLNTVAESTSPVRGYARGILGLLKDRRFYPETYESGQERSMFSDNSSSLSKEIVRLYPIPAANTLIVSWPAMQPDANAELQVFDLLGKSRIQENLSSSETQWALNVAHLSAGVYFLVISDKGKPISRAKFTIQR